MEEIYTRVENHIEVKENFSKRREIEWESGKGCTQNTA